MDFSKSMQVDLYYDWAFARDWHIKVEGYYQHLYDIPVVNDPASTWTMLQVGGAVENVIIPKGNLVNKGTGRNYGVELTIEKFLSDNYYLLLNGTLYRATYTTGFDDKRWNSVFDGRYIVNATGGYEWSLPKN